MFSCNKEDYKSPVDINNSVLDTSLTALFDDYRPTDCKITNKETYLMIEASDNFLVIPKNDDFLGEEVELRGILIKSLSEHTVKGEHYPLELQFFHTDTNQNIVIASVFVKAGEENSEFDKIIKNIPDVNDTKNISNLDLYSLFPESIEYWYYIGTTTNTPVKKCRWFIMKNTIEVSKSQIKAIQDIIGKNIVETVGLEDRKIYENQ